MFTDYVIVEATAALVVVLSGGAVVTRGMLCALGAVRTAPARSTWVSL